MIKHLLWLIAMFRDGWWPLSLRALLMQGQWIRKYPYSNALDSIQDSYTSRRLLEAGFLTQDELMRKLYPLDYQSIDRSKWRAWWFERAKEKTS